MWSYFMMLVEVTHSSVQVFTIIQIIAFIYKSCLVYTLLYIS